MHAYIRQLASQHDGLLTTSSLMRGVNMFYFKALDTYYLTERILQKHCDDLYMNDTLL